MVISAAGMAICLLCGSCGGKEESRGALEREGTAGRKAEEASRQVWEEQEERKQQEAQERAARLESYRTCSSGTRIEDVLSEEETDSLFYASEIPAEVFRRMNGVSYVENDDIALADLRYLRMLYVGFDGEPHVLSLIHI